MIYSENLPTSGIVSFPFYRLSNPGQRQDRSAMTTPPSPSYRAYIYAWDFIFTGRSSLLVMLEKLCLPPIFKSYSQIINLDTKCGTICDKNARNSAVPRRRQHEMFLQQPHQGFFPTFFQTYENDHIHWPRTKVFTSLLTLRSWELIQIRMF